MKSLDQEFDTDTLLSWGAIHSWHLCIS